MKYRKWWDAAFVTVAVATGAITLIEPAHRDDVRGVVPVLLGFLVVYAAVGRWAIGHEDRMTARQPIAAGLFVLLLAAGCAIAPGFAFLQTVLYPFVWTTACKRRLVILENVLIAAAVFAGYVVGMGGSAVTGAFFSAGLSLLFSLALGTWIERMARWGEERARLLEELQAAQGALAAANRESGVESERARLAREIHDTIAQSLTGLVMVAQRAGRRLGRTDADPDARADVALIESLAREALAEARALVAASAPAAPEAGLVASVARVAASFERETGLAVAVDAAVPDGVLDREREVVLLRSVQEGLANVRKHAGATSARVVLAVEDGTVRASVEDDGRGPGAPAGATSPAGGGAEADPAAVGPNRSGVAGTEAGADGADAIGGFGLAGLRDRVGLVGGSLEFGRRPEGGARLVVRVPEAAGEAAADDSAAPS